MCSADDEARRPPGPKRFADRPLPHRLRGVFLGGVVSAALLVTALLEPLPQDPAYHDFADFRDFFGLPNTLNSLSNLPFLVVGGLGLGHAFRGHLRYDKRLHPVVITFFLSLLLLAITSAAYHIVPNNVTLAWDRLSMSLAFMALTTLVIAERIDLRAGWRLFGPLLLTGAGSVAWWIWTESQGRGDLRPYALVQFLPLLLLPVVLILYRSRWTGTAGLWAAMICYLIAKLCEVFDEQIFAALSVSGHTLKHLAAAAAGWCLLRMLQTRQRTCRPGRAS